MAEQADHKSKSNLNSKFRILNEHVMNHKDETLQYLVFRTSLHDRMYVERVSQTLNDLPGIRGWFVDLDDREKVLRIECIGLEAAIVIQMLQNKGVIAEPLHVEEYPVMLRS